MQQNKLFSQTRWQLVIWYASVMSFILGLLGFGVDRAIIHAHWQTLNREIEVVAGTLHDDVEKDLRQPGRLEPTIQQLLPQIPQRDKHHILGAIHQGDYYARFLSLSGENVAFLGFLPDGLPLTPGEPMWQTLIDSKGNRYHQISLSLHTQDNRPWGYIQVGRSLSDVDAYLANVKLVLWLGLPIAIVLVAVSSWWLAGRAMQPVYQSYQQIQQFTADAAHELRTPLAALAATVESALRSPHLPEPEAREILQTVNRQNQRLTALVADLLLLSRMERQSLSVQHQVCCLNDIISDLVEELESLALAAAVTLKAEIKVYKPLQIVGDEEQIYRLVTNLMVNAIQYTPIGGCVRAILDKEDDRAIIRVTDTGIGIAPEHQQRIFDRFYRVNSDRSRITGGSGLGLAIAMAIVQAHKGSLEVHSELGKGSTFTVRLPAAGSSEQGAGRE
ncbi:two-component sensor histidine kinase [cyanobacterium TDX16]|nr:two-component sensor histidine kinase [cyanobacterium TDX16]